MCLLRVFLYAALYCSFSNLFTQQMIYWVPSICHAENQECTKVRQSPGSPGVYILGWKIDKQTINQPTNQPDTTFLLETISVSRDRAMEEGALPQIRGSEKVSLKE